jgi:transposase-like protein
MPRPIDPAKREAILADIRAGELGRNEIARRHEVAGSTVTLIASQEGLLEAFDRAETKAATNARVVAMTEARASLATASVEVAQIALARMRKALPKANAKDAAIAYGIAVDKHLLLARFDSDDGAADAASLVKGLADGLAAAYDQMTSGGSGDRPGSPAAEPEAAP